HAAAVAEDPLAAVGGGLPLMGTVAEDVLELVVGQALERSRLHQSRIGLNIAVPVADEGGQPGRAGTAVVQDLALGVVQRGRRRVGTPVAHRLAPTVGGMPAVGPVARCDVNVARGQPATPAIGDVLSLVAACTDLKLGAVA